MFEASYEDMQRSFGHTYRVRGSFMTISDTIGGLITSPFRQAYFEPRAQQTWINSSLSTISHFRIKFPSRRVMKFDRVAMLPGSMNPIIFHCDRWNTSVWVSILKDNMSKRTMGRIPCITPEIAMLICEYARPHRPLHWACHNRGMCIPTIPMP
jgi:hypothetical protein